MQIRYRGWIVKCLAYGSRGSLGDTDPLGSGGGDQYRCLYAVP